MSKDEVKKVYGYIRVSTGTQIDGYGLKMQEEAIRRYCKDNKLELVEIFKDEGISGATDDMEDDVSIRPGLTDMLGALNGINRIVVLNTARVWRNDTSKVLIRRELKKANADIISIEQPNYSIYNQDPNDFLINGMQELLDQYERMTINLKLSKGRRTKARQGSKACGTAPIGYKWDNANIIVDEAARPIVEEIYSKYMELGSFGKVQKYLIKEGHKTSTGKDFTRQAIQNILTNPFYKGVLIHGEVETQGTHEPIINKIVWGRVQSRIKANSKSK